MDTFDCGQPALNQFLQRYALVNQKANSAQTYVSCQGGEVVGFYSLAVGSINPEDAPARVMKGLARHAVPVMILARLAVDRDHQGKGLGKALLQREQGTDHGFCPTPSPVATSKFSHRAIPRAISASPTTVGEILRRAKLAGITWPLPAAACPRKAEPAFLPALSAECLAFGGRRDEAAFPPYLAG
jgi:GNAT superfamily N-acetyltransferase